MKRASILLAIFAVAWVGRSADAADLAKVDRRIAKEPKYTSGPLYALLLFGPDAAKRVWLVLDGEVLYVDRNGNGDLTEPNERVLLDVEATKKIKVAPGEYTGMNVFPIGEIEGVPLQLDHWVRDPNYKPPQDEHEILAKWRKERMANGWESSSLMRTAKDGSVAQNPLTLCTNPKGAQVCHLAGPLTFSLKWGDRQVLKRGDGEHVFDVHIGTPGLLPRSQADGPFAPLTTKEVPADIHPVAHFEFRHKTPGEPPITLDVMLDRRC